jgi:hypothetical protein
VLRHGIEQSISFITPKEAYAAARLLEHSNFGHRTDPTPILTREVKNPANYLEGSVDRRVPHPVFFPSIVDEGLQRGHIDGIESSRAQIGLELPQVVAIVTQALLLRTDFKVSHDGLWPYETARRLMS